MMTPTETRKSSGATDRGSEDQDQLLARLIQYSMTERLEENNQERTLSSICSDSMLYLFHGCHLGAINTIVLPV